MNAMNLGRTLSGLSLVTLGTLAVIGCGDRRTGFGEEPSEDPGFNSTADGGLADAAEDICGSKEVKAEAVPLAMIVLIDRSGSMSGEKWSTATTAIRAFADRAEVVGMKMGVQFFPPLDTSKNQCDASGYTNLAVPIAPLPDNVIPIQQKLLNTAADGGGTPMRSGLEGSIAAMQTFIQQTSAHAGAVILVTDGDPTACGGISEVASVATNGANAPAGTPKVKTFAVGMEGASFSNLDTIAKGGGGAPKSFNVGAGATAQQSLLEALETIRTGALGCEYVLPPVDGLLDLDSVVVKFTPGQNDPVVDIRRVADEGSCGATTGGYYYDDPKAPSRVVLCPATCKAVQGAPVEAKVDLSLGCIRAPK